MLLPHLIHMCLLELRNELQCNRSIETVHFTQNFFFSPINAFSVCQNPIKNVILHLLIISFPSFYYLDTSEVSSVKARYFIDLCQLLCV